MSESDSALPKITLHWLEVSRAHRIMWLLEELNIPYELKTYKRTKEKLADPKLKEVHPLGKSPIVTVEAPGQDKITLIESGNIVEYLCDYYGKHLIPKRYKDGKEGQIGAETESFLRHRTFMHYAEGSIQPLILISLLFKLVTDGAPWFVKPIANGIQSSIWTTFLGPNFKTHYAWIESQLETSPDGGDYLCGKELSAADIMMSFPLEAGKGRSGLKREDSPRVWAWIDRLRERESYKRTIKKVEEVEGSFKVSL